MTDLGHNARSLANYVVEKGIDSSTPYDPLQVIKLTYLCHGWMLGIHDRPLSQHPVEAWKYGPVIQAVYDMVRSYGSKPITRKFHFPMPNLEVKEHNIVIQVLEAYKKYSGVDLSDLTHQKGTPWDTVYHREGRNAIIPNKLIQDHFVGLMNGKRSSL